MPIELGIWRIGETLERVSMSPIDSEATLEEMLASDLSVLSADLMLLGRQVSTAYGKFIDLLAMNAEGNLVVIELKKSKTPRDVVAQTLDYASWVKTLSFDEIAEIYGEQRGGKQLEEGFQEAFGSSLPEEINQSHQLLVVASELDPATERIISYLGDTHNVPINAVFFRHFRDGDRNYLARSWLVDPQEVESKVSKKGSEPWSGRDFYVSLGEGPHRTWEDAQRYGFVSGGQGKWYIQTLKLLFPGARVFVNIPGTGYVGVGRVEEEVVPVKEFMVTVDGNQMPILDAPMKAPNVSENADNPELAEHLVRVEWLRVVPREKAYWETGLFAVQHTACRMRSRFTIEKLTKHFGLDEE